MTNIRRAIALISLLVLGLTVGGQAPALAARTDCPSGYFCLWTSTNYSGSRYQWPQTTFNIAPNTGIAMGCGVSNRGYSFYNHLTQLVYIYDDGHCHTSPWYRQMSAGQYATAQGSDWGGRVSSVGLARSLN